jgi:septal ring factor EnvC (AmiA/AmiB activator)|tara:strand:+ start:271 stop:762 length:492 start_codon:yes stop_codon:yes gene_type:complete
MVEIDPLTGLPKELLAMEEIGREQQLSQDQQRLEKLWDAYEQQEKDLNAALNQINILEAEITSLRRLLKESEPTEANLSSKLHEVDGILEGEQGPDIDKLETLESRGRQTKIVVDPVADIMNSKSEGGPYSRVEQLEKLIELRNKSEIKPEEFEEMKKEILGK